MTPSRAIVTLPLLFASAIVLVNCQVVGGYHEFERSEPSVTPPPNHQCDKITPRTKLMHGASSSAALASRLLLIVDPDASCFWMNRTEVTVEQYRTWLGSLDPERRVVWDPDRCSWKSAEARPFDPDAPGDACQIPNPPPSSPKPFDNKQPIRCVDWCEADAYCRWAGGRLCNVSTLSSEDEWAIACSAGYTQPYAFDPTAPEHPCSYGQDCSTSCGPLLADQDENCRPGAGYPLNLAGNVAEWANQCLPAGDAIFCNTRGGSYVSPLADLACSNATEGSQVATRDAALGFRCCADLTGEEEALLP